MHRPGFPTTRLAAVVWVLAFAGCGGGSDGGGAVPPALTAGFTGSGAGAAPDFVRLRSASAAGDRITLDVALGGPTSSIDIYSFAFDLVLGDPTVVQYVSPSVAAGDVLTPSGGQTLSVQASQTGNRVVVGMTKLGGGAGNGSAAAEGTVVRLTFRALKAGVSTVTFSGAASSSNPAGIPAAFDSTGAIDAGIDFDPVPATIRGT